MHELRFAFRVLARSRGFAAASIATLALGIGASTAIFSVAYGVAVRPLPYPEPGRLVRIYEANAAQGEMKHEVSIGTFAGWREGVPSIESAALYSRPRVRYLAGADAPAVRIRSVSPGFFEVIGVKPMLGPGFKPEKEYTRFNADEEAVLSFAAWQRLFGGRRDLGGATLEFVGVGDNDVYRVVGIMPEGFAFEEAVDMWKPSLIVEQPVSRLRRMWRYDRVVARLRPGATTDGARAELETVAARLARDFPSTSAGWTATIESLHDAIVGSFGRTAWLLLATVGVVLLVTCLNVGGLLVARSVARERETAVRVALGAGSWRLLRLRLAEACTIAVPSALLGVVLAGAGVAALKAAAPPGIPRLDAIALDIPALAVAALATLLAFAIFTAAPLRRRLDALRPAGAGGRRKKRTMRTALTIGQCAGAAALVVLAVMLTRSFINLMSADLGWSSAGLLSMSVSPPMPRELRRPWARYADWADRLMARLEAMPGIERAAITTHVPLAGSSPATLARGRGKSAQDQDRWPGVEHIVTDGYFELMQIRVLSGRTFGAGDRFTGAQLTDSDLRPDRGVAVVTESTARALWPGQSAVGQAIWLPDLDTVQWREVVGVLEDIQFHTVGEAPALHVFVPWTQMPSSLPRLLVKSSTGRAASIVDNVREVVRSVEPGTRIDQVATLDSLVARATAQPRFATRLVAAFGALALLLAAVGIYGTLSLLVSARTREIGIRLALGATPGGIMSTVLRHGLIPAVAGGIVGLGIAFALARSFRALFFEIAPLDVLSFAGGAFVLLVVAVIASVAPARRASRVDPAVALRVE